MSNTFFKQAKRMSKMSDFWMCHTGCVVVYKGKVISTGYNSFKTHPIQCKYNKLRFPEDSPHSLHSEIHALSHIAKAKNINWSKVHVYTYRENDSGNIAMSRPCTSCMGFIKDLGIKHIHYTTPDGYASEVLVY